MYRANISECEQNIVIESIRQSADVFLGVDVVFAYAFPPKSIRVRCQSQGVRATGFVEESAKGGITLTFWRTRQKAKYTIVIQ